MLIAVSFETVSNIFLKISNGFKKIWFGIFSVLFMLGSFFFLSKSIQVIDLSIAYVLWGGVGIIITTFSSWVIFNQKLNKFGWIGLLLVIIGIILIKIS